MSSFPNDTVLGRVHLDIYLPYQHQMAHFYSAKTLQWLKALPRFTFVLLTLVSLFLFARKHDLFHEADVSYMRDWKAKEALLHACFVHTGGHIGSMLPPNAQITSCSYFLGRKSRGDILVKTKAFFPSFFCIHLCLIRESLRLDSPLQKSHTKHMTKLDKLNSVLLLGHR